MPRDIIAELRRQRDAHEAAGRLVAAQECRQQIIAHGTLARLRCEPDTPAIRQQIARWSALVDEDPGAGPAADKAAKPRKAT
jgi:hypothetical protein